MSTWGNVIISPTASLGYWGTQALNVGTTVTDSAAAVTGCNRAEVTFSRVSPTGLREDLAAINFTIMKEAGALASFFTSGADLNAALTPLTTALTSLQAKMSSAWTIKEVRWYVVRDDQAHSGPAVRVDPIALTGSVAASRFPDQVSQTVSFITASRKHWGRVYLPGISSNHNDVAQGRITSAHCDATALIFRTMANSLQAAGFQLGVWSPTARSFLTLHELHVDDVWDIVRRRRAKQTLYRKVYTS